MAVTTVVSKTPSSAKQTKAATAGSKKPISKLTHPKTSDMVNNAIIELKERSGSSLQAIKKYISAQYKVDVEKLAPFIRKYLKSAVESGALIQTKCKGASGSFKLEAKVSSGTKKYAAGKSAGGRPKKVSTGATSPKKAAVSASPSKVSRPATKDKRKTVAKSKPAAVKAESAATKLSAAAPKAKKNAKRPTKNPKPKKAAAPKAKSAAKKGTRKK